MANGFYCTVGGNLPTMDNATCGLGNRRSILLSYGASGGFPRFTRVSGQSQTRRKRSEGMSVATQEVAQSVPDFPLEARHIREWGVTVIGHPTTGYSLRRGLRERAYPLKGSTLKEATGNAILAYIAAASPDDMFRRPQEPKAPARAGMVYFIGGDVGSVKIGFAVNPEIRVRDLQCGSPIVLRILAVTPGMPKCERDYHKRFAAHRLHGEWFERCPEILAEIERLNAPTQSETR